jgi:hypothetical protein
VNVIIHKWGVLGLRFVGAKDIRIKYRENTPLRVNGFLLMFGQKEKDPNYNGMFFIKVRRINEVKPSPIYPILGGYAKVCIGYI